MGVFMPARRCAMFSCACLSSSGSRLRTACMQDISFISVRTILIGKLSYEHTEVALVISSDSA